MDGQQLRSIRALLGLSIDSDASIISHSVENKCHDLLSKIESSQSDQAKEQYFIMYEKVSLAKDLLLKDALKVSASLETLISETDGKDEVFDLSDLPVANIDTLEVGAAFTNSSPAFLFLHQQLEVCGSESVAEINRRADNKISDLMLKVDAAPSDALKEKFFNVVESIESHRYDYIEQLNQDVSPLINDEIPNDITEEVIQDCVIEPLIDLPSEAVKSFEDSKEPTEELTTVNCDSVETQPIDGLSATVKQEEHKNLDQVDSPMVIGAQLMAAPPKESIFNTFKLTSFNVDNFKIYICSIKNLILEFYDDKVSEKDSSSDNNFERYKKSRHKLLKSSRKQSKIFISAAFISTVMLILGIQLTSQSERAWESASNINTVVSYREFIKNWPSELQVLKAQAAIETLDHIDFNRARKQNTITSCENYLENWSDGLHSSDCKEFIRKLLIFTQSKKQ